MGIFEAYRVRIDGTRLAVNRLGTETFVTVSVEKAFQIYGCAKLRLVLVSQPLPSKIRALASFRDFTFAAFSSRIAVFKRFHQVATWSAPNANVNSLLVFGDHVRSVDVDGDAFIWAFKGVEEAEPSPVGHNKLDDNFTPTCLMHPETYVNKILLGSQQGSLQLWNTNTSKKLYEFKGWGSSVTSCVSSPALDIVAVGCADGKVHVHNI